MRMLLLGLSFFSSFCFAERLRTGDVLLQEINCYLCNMISAEGNSIYSHVGLVVVENGIPNVYQAFGHSVHKVSYEKFRSQNGLKREAHYRPTFFESRDELSFTRLAQSYLGHGYDPYFVWDNKDQQGNELLYCSEFVAKVFNRYFKTILVPTRPMSFKKYYSHWIKYFNGQVPEGKAGVHPAAFENLAHFRLIAQ